MAMRSRPVPVRPTPNRPPPAVRMETSQKTATKARASETSDKNSLPRRGGSIEIQPVKE